MYCFETVQYYLNLQGSIIFPHSHLFSPPTNVVYRATSCSLPTQQCNQSNCIKKNLSGYSPTFPRNLTLCSISLLLTALDHMLANFYPCRQFVIARSVHSIPQQTSHIFKLSTLSACQPPTFSPHCNL
jgi:hypothetical protein